MYLYIYSKISTSLAIAFSMIIISHLAETFFTIMNGV